MNRPSHILSLLLWLPTALTAGTVGASSSTADQHPAHRTSVPTASTALFIDGAQALAALYGEAWTTHLSPEHRANALRLLAESLPPGGAIHLPTDHTCGDLDFRGIADDIQITGGTEGSLTLGGGQKGLHILFTELEVRFAPGVERPWHRRRPVLLSAASASSASSVSSASFDDFGLLEEKKSPVSQTYGLFCDGGIKISQDLKHCVWIAGSNAFGMRTVTADARVDDSLFLWFGLNWPFQDYNGHLNPHSFKPNKKTGEVRQDWTTHTQMHWNLKGGGHGTRLYNMVETNYGNPGSGVVLENAKGLALYQGTTERSSAQGPGVYHLKNCEDVHIGLRGLNAFARVDHYVKCACPTRDITIEGGRGNILHAVRFWNHAQEATIVNSDPQLSVWSCSFQYETRGLDLPSITKFCVNEGDQLPSAQWLTEAQPGFDAYADWQIAENQKTFKVADASPELEWLKGKRSQFLQAFSRGRYHDVPMTAKTERVLSAEGKDPLKGDTLSTAPLPPSVPATDAPVYERPLAYTQSPDFGQALRDAGADPTGNKPSDDAICHVLYGMKRAALAALMAEADEADTAFRTARTKGDASAQATAKARIDTVMATLAPEIITTDEQGKTRKEKAKRPPLHIPPGRFRLEHPLVLLTYGTLIGAGPEKTTLFTEQPITLLERRSPPGGGTIGNLRLEGGRIGLGFLGADHHDPVSPTRHAYVAGSNVFNIHFKDQTTAGIWVGQEPADVMGGAEHDQNKYVQLTFDHTGDYGIYMNQNMLDKWLCLHCSFVGQKKAGIRIPFNNVIKGSLVHGQFRSIAGPGLDVFGGNPEISYTPSLFFVDGCEFTECGNETEPAVDLGYCTLSSFTHSKVTTQGKKILAGVKAAAQIYEDIHIDVKLTDQTNPALVLRAVRDAGSSRANGHTLKNVTSSGRYAFVNDINANLARYEPTLKKLAVQREERLSRGEKLGPAEPVNFDRNPLKHQRPPDSGWNHPFYFYGCHFSGQPMKPTLINADTQTGSIKSSLTF